MKKLAAIAVCAVMSMSFVATASAETVKIGVFEPETGENGASGMQETLGIVYANEETPTVTIDGEEYDVELVIVDNESSDGEEAEAAAQALVSDGVSIVLGSNGSTTSMAGSPIFEEAGIPVIAPTATNPQVTEDNDHYFRICFLDPFQGTVLASFAQEELGAVNVFYLGEEDYDYAVGLEYYFENEFYDITDDEDADVIFEEYSQDDVDFTGYIAEAIGMDADVIFCPTSTEAAEQIIQAAIDMDCDIPILAGDTWDSNVVLNAAQGSGLDIYVTAFYQEGGSPEFDEAISAWIENDETSTEYNGGDNTVSSMTAMGYDAYQVALAALENAGSAEPADVLAALPDTSVEGVTGTIEFDENGDAVRDTAYIKKANTDEGCWELTVKQKVVTND